MSWTKLFSSIVTSSIWCEDDATLRVWIAMLAMCDHGGVVEGSIPGFASLARVTVPQMEAALERLLAPDSHSRTPDNEGRRVETIDGGWRILNYELHRQRCQDKEGSHAPAMRRYREKRMRCNELPQKVTDGNALPLVVTRDPVGVTGDTEERRERREERYTEAAVAASVRRQPITAPNGIDVDALRAEGRELITAIAQLRDEDPTEVLKRASMYSPGNGAKARYLVSLDSASPNWLIRTVHDLRDELRQLEARAQEERMPLEAGRIVASADLRRRICDTNPQARGEPIADYRARIDALIQEFV